MTRLAVRALATRLAVILGAAAMLSLAAAPAAAHTELVSVTPAAGERLPAAPPAVTLTFDEAIDPRFATVVISGPTGQLPSTTPARVDNVNVSQLLEGPVAPGDYVVRYRVVSADGHPVEGETSFAIEPPPAAEPSATPTGEPSPPADPSATPLSSPSTPAPDGSPVAVTDSAADNSGSGAMVGITIGALGVVALVAGGAVAARRRGPVAPPAGGAAASRDA